MIFEVTKLGVKGQVVIPSTFRKNLSLKSGDKFIVMAEENAIIFKKVIPPKKEDLKKILSIALEHSKKYNLTEHDLEQSIKKVRE